MSPPQLVGTFLNSINEIYVRHRPKIITEPFAAQDRVKANIVQHYSFDRLQLLIVECKITIKSRCSNSIRPPIIFLERSMWLRDQCRGREHY